MKVIDELLDNLTITEKRVVSFPLYAKFKKKLKENGCDIEEDSTKATAVKFYKTSREYLQQWTLFFNELEIYEWANLRKLPTCAGIQRVTDILLEHGFINATKDAEIFFMNLHLFVNILFKK